MTEAVLGPAAEASGAKCSKISRSSPGTGYLYVDGGKGFRKFRIVFIADDEADKIAKGETPHSIVTTAAAVIAQQDSLNRQKTAVYRLYDEMGYLLYVGITNNPNIRLKEHAAEKPWWSVVDQRRTTIEWYKNRGMAKRTETKAITTENPKYNVSEIPVSG
jgi:predicted GIY-YIG superfamily endonuclease